MYNNVIKYSEQHSRQTRDHSEENEQIIRFGYLICEKN